MENFDKVIWQTLKMSAWKMWQIILASGRDEEYN